MNSLSLGKKIIDETSPKDVLRFAKLQFDSKNFSKCKSVLRSFVFLHRNIPKKITDELDALFLLVSLLIFADGKSEEIAVFFNEILDGFETLKELFDQNFINSTFDALEQNEIELEQIMSYSRRIVHLVPFLIKYDLELVLNVMDDERFFTLIKSKFPYIFKYLIIATVLEKSDKHVLKLKQSFSNLSEKDVQNSPFTQLFLDIFTNFDVENAVKNMKNCEKLMKEEYFIVDLSNLFFDKCKEILLNDYIKLNGLIDVSVINPLFTTLEKDAAKSEIINNIKRLYPFAKITRESESEIEYINEDESEMQKCYEIKTQELYTLTQSMVGYMKQMKLNEEE